MVAIPKGTVCRCLAPAEGGTDWLCQSGPLVLSETEWAIHSIMGKKKKKRKFLEALLKTRNLLHLHHITSDVNYGPMEKSKKRKKKQERKKIRQECRECENL